MEVLIIFIFILVMMASLGIGFPVGFALPGAAIISLFLAAIAGIILREIQMPTLHMMVPLNGLMQELLILEELIGIMIETR